LTPPDTGVAASKLSDAWDGTAGHRPIEAGIEQDEVDGADFFHEEMFSGACGPPVAQESEGKSS
jgi:hypothetical protein